MFPYQFYKAMHIVGLIMIFSGLAGILFLNAAKATPKKKIRLTGFITHGIGMALTITGGFGMLARLGIAQNGIPSWIYSKLVIWILLGLSMSIAKRWADKTLSALSIFISLGLAATLIVLYK